MCDLHILFVEQAEDTPSVPRILSLLCAVQFVSDSFAFHQWAPELRSFRFGPQRTLFKILEAEDKSPRVVIVGGGFAGLSVAARLAQSGLLVTLLESARLGFHASMRNQGWNPGLGTL